MRFQGVWAGSGQGLQGQHQKKNPRPPARRSPNPNSKRGCTRGGQPTPCMLSQVSIHSTRFGPLPQVWTGQGGPGLSERHGHMHVCRDPDATLHFILSPETLTHRAGPLSLRARGTAVHPRACSPGRPCLKSVPSTPRVWTPNGLAVADTISPGKPCPLSQGSKEQGRG